MVVKDNISILIPLLEQYNVRTFVLSPGSQSVPISRAVTMHPSFIHYSVVDERSAAYFAVGLSLELKSPVAVVSTTAQAMRNYIPGMTEAFYRRTPVLAITADRDISFVDQQCMQVIRQMSFPTDAAKVSVDIPIIKDDLDSHLVTRRINEALDALTRNGGGPAHMNVRMRTSATWTVRKPYSKVRKISRHMPLDKDWPIIDQDKTVLLVIGAHLPFSKSEQDAVEQFAQKHNAAVYVSHISNYNGKKAVHGNAVISFAEINNLKPDLLITIGGLLGDYPLYYAMKGLDVPHWRVNADGKFSDTYNAVTDVFECPESFFFERMSQAVSNDASESYWDAWIRRVKKFVPPQRLPLSHAWVAQQLSPIIPKYSRLHFGILNSLRNWDLVSLDPSIQCYSNVAGFGIDGAMSTFLGQSVATDSMCFLIIGDLSFFYDMNSIGIKHIKNNVRIVLINNNGGAEFCLQGSPIHQCQSKEVKKNIIASGHFGESAEGWVRNNGFEYLSVRSKDDLDEALNVFVQESEKPIVLEVFTIRGDDAGALSVISGGQK